MSENTNPTSIENNAENNIQNTNVELNVTGNEMDAVSKKKSISQMFPNVAEFMEQNFKQFEMDDKEFEELAFKDVPEIKEDELIKGKIVSITKDEVLVDINFKSYGIIPKGELVNSEAYFEGEEIDVYIEKVEDTDGKIILSRRRADFMRIWKDILALHKNQEVIKVKIIRKIKGGMMVELFGIEAFLPGSQIDIRPIKDFDSWVGQNIEVKVVKVNNPYENVIVSHKILLEELLADQRMEIMNRLEKGLVLEGVVKAISEFGVFVDLGGIDGLVHITDLSWGRVQNPREVVEEDTAVRVVVLDFDKVKQRIALGMKQLTPHPWDEIGDKYVEGTKVGGKVVSLTEYGAFIEIEKGIEGLIHLREMSWTQHVKYAHQVLQIGQYVEALVLSIDKSEKKLSLGMKQLTPDPWEDIIKKFPIGSKQQGVIRHLSTFGAFVELEQGVEGLIYVADLSWTKRFIHPAEIFRKGDDIDVVILNVDSEQRRISLGHRQLKENPWEKLEEVYPVGMETEARIERIIEKGVIIGLPDDVDGFVPSSQLSFAPIKHVRNYFEPGDILPLKVVEFDKETKKIVLSVVECLRGKDQAIIDKYNKQHPVPHADRYSSGTELSEHIKTYQPGDKEVDEIIKQEFSYPELPEDIVSATIHDITVEKNAEKLGMTIEEYKEYLEIEKAKESAKIVSVEEVAPVVEEVTPAVEEVAPAVEEVAPAVEEVAPAVEEVAPAVEEVAPAVEEVAPDVEEVAPDVEEVAETEEVSDEDDEYNEDIVFDEDDEYDDDDEVPDKEKEEPASLF